MCEIKDEDGDGGTNLFVIADVVAIGAADDGDVELRFVW